MTKLEQLLEWMDDAEYAPSYGELREKVVELMTEEKVKSVDLDDVGETFNECTTQIGMNRCTSCGSMYCDGNICT